MQLVNLYLFVSSMKIISMEVKILMENNLTILSYAVKKNHENCSACAKLVKLKWIFHSFISSQADNIQQTGHQWLESLWTWMILENQKYIRWGRHILQNCGGDLGCYYHHHSFSSTLKLPLASDTCSPIFSLLKSLACLCP